MPLSKGSKQIDGPFKGNGLELCRDLQGFMRRLELARGTIVLSVDHAAAPDSTAYRCTKYGVVDGPDCEQCRQESEECNRG